MLSVEAILLVLWVICMITAIHMYKKSVTSTIWRNQEIKNKKLWNIAMVFMMKSTVILGLVAASLVVRGLRTGIVFKQPDIIAFTALAISIPMLGYRILQLILDWERRYWKWIVTIILVLLPISAGAVELLYQSKIETNTYTKTEVLETVQLMPGIEIITCMNIREEGPFFVFSTKDGGYDSVLAEQATPTFIESDPYMEKRKLTTVIEAKYPNGIVEEREVSTETDYMFYAPKDLFYGLNDHN